METDKPVKLLRLPVIIWALTLAYGTGLMLYLITIKTSANYNPGIVFYSFLCVLAVNFITLITMLSCIKFYEKHRRSFIKRTELLFSNVAVAFIYLLIVRNNL